MDQRLPQTERHKLIPLLIPEGGTKWVTIMIIDKCRKQKYIWTNIHMKMCISYLPQKRKKSVDCESNTKCCVVEIH